MTSPRITLNDGTSMPQLGLGVFRIPANDTERVVSEALEIGYRLIDTAASYENEAGVGRAIAKSGIPREEIYVITKLWNIDHTANIAPQAFQRSLDTLGLDYVDMYLMHWPIASAGLFVDIWRQFEQFKADGRTRSIGASNYRIQDLERIINETSVVPAINQIEVHPLFTQNALRGYGEKHGIVTQAWGPFGHTKINLFVEGAIPGIAAAHGVTPAQVLLRWYLQHGWPVVGKTENSAHLKENWDVFGFSLTADDMAALDAMNQNRRVGPDPDLVDA
ncbi:aldo/keto reductase [Paraburkholderia dipogonis]|uniref:Aldo/keto reductase n=2 Tax=Paraburkholderia dipogonis TaxID=1211383 RepID=A0A4Y8MHI6_9BURK|nr:aldo/keto reductase [Paraburkholderia dipogonis]